MVLKELLVIMMVLRQGVHKVVVLCPVHVSVGQRYSSDGFLCLGDFFHHGLRDSTSGVVVCRFAWLIYSLREFWFIKCTRC